MFFQGKQNKNNMSQYDNQDNEIPYFKPNTSKSVKNKKYSGFREYVEDDDRHPKGRRIDESHKDKMKFKDKIRKFNLSDYRRSTVDEDYDEETDSKLWKEVL